MGAPRFRSRARSAGLLPVVCVAALVLAMVPAAEAVTVVAYKGWEYRTRDGASPTTTGNGGCEDDWAALPSGFSIAPDTATRLRGNNERRFNVPLEDMLLPPTIGRRVVLVLSSGDSMYSSCGRMHLRYCGVLPRPLHGIFDLEEKNRRDPFRQGHVAAGLGQDAAPVGEYSTSNHMKNSF